MDDFIEHLSARTGVLDAIRDTGELSDETQATLKQAVEDFTQAFVRSDAGERSEAGVGQGAPRTRSSRTSGGTGSSADDEDEPPGSGG